jgi:ATP-binding cassette, subfamily C (CFTR/MRP), member 1
VAKVQGNGSFSILQAVTALTATQLLSVPLMNLLLAIPAGWASMGCFTRIQDFLLQDSRTDPRQFIASTSPDQVPSSSSGDFELPTLQPHGSKAAFCAEDSSFGWSDSGPNIVKGVTTEVRPETFLTILVGPVGCGKSSLLKGFLGETPKSNGKVSTLYSQIAYCDQTPWITNGSVRDNIVAAAEFDEVWYRSVVHACTLDIDMKRLPNGDETIVGSKGVKLSGGQKQRLVRAPRQA